MNNEKGSAIPTILDIIGTIIITFSLFCGWLFFANTQELIISAAFVFGGFSSGILFFAVGKIIECLQDSVRNQEDILLKLNEGVQKLEYLSWNGRVNK